VQCALKHETILCNYTSDIGKPGSARDKRGRRGSMEKQFRGQLAVQVPKKNKKAFTHLKQGVPEV